jgi:drug/metabolite transporter (DMT)-like permease
LYRKKRSDPPASARDNAGMKRRDVADLILLAALWGASFLFTRMAVPAFGAIALAEVRVAVAALVLLPLLAWRGDLADLRVQPARFALLGALNTAIPFSLFAWAVLSITAGLASILNATAPLFTALVAWLWLRERLGARQWLGMVIGLAGVLWLTGARVGFAGGSSGWAVVAALAATLSYGVSGNVAKRLFTGVRPLAVAAGSQTAAALLLLPLSIAAWPSQNPALADWSAAVALGVFCTGLAYILYFRLIARVGPAQAMTVTFLIPAFAMLWGTLFLGESVTPAMLTGCVIILAGTALASGMVKSFSRATAATRAP